MKKNYKALIVQLIIIVLLILCFGAYALSFDGFTSIPIAEFCGFDNIDLCDAQLSAYENDCEAGMIPADAKLDIESLLALKVTDKENSECVTGGTFVYVLADENGNGLASFEFYNGLLVMDDGMYRVE